MGRRTGISTRAMISAEVDRLTFRERHRQLVQTAFPIGLHVSSATRINPDLTKEIKQKDSKGKASISLLFVAVPR
jgi:hypothetical protein